MLLWGAAVGMQESTLAVVADIGAAPRRASAYGVFAAGLGTASAIGGAPIGWLYDVSTTTLLVMVLAIQAVALVGVLAIRLPRSASG